MFKGKFKFVNMANLFAMAMIIYTANAACAWLHHQPEFPEDAKQFRKF